MPPVAEGSASVPFWASALCSLRNASNGMRPAPQVNSLSRRQSGWFDAMAAVVHHIELTAGAASQ
jgi:hypothetical protein